MYREDFDFEEHINYLIDVVNAIDTNKITVLTGPNGYGKSLIRKLMPSHVAEVRGVEGRKQCTASISMQQRTNSNPAWGALSSIMCDMGHNPTSLESYNLASRLSQKNLDGMYLIFDEPEVGMSEEGILGWTEWFKKNFSDYKHGALIITHSRIMVEQLNGMSEFINLAGMTRDEFLKRKVEPLDFEKLSDFSHKLFLAVEDRIDRTKKKKRANKN